MARFPFRGSPHLEERMGLTHITMMGTEGVPSLVVEGPRRHDDVPGFFEDIQREAEMVAQRRRVQKTLARYGLNDL